MEYLQGQNLKDILYENSAITIVDAKLNIIIISIPYPTNDKDEPFCNISISYKNNLAKS